MIKFQEKAVVLSVKSFPWEISGRSGTAHNVRLAINHEIYPVKTTEKVADSLRDKVDQEVDVVLVLESFREEIKLSLEFADV